MQYKFHAYGHPNILATHKTTLEFTKDEDLTKNGDCIVGIKANFELGKLKDFIKKSKNKRIIITIETPDKKFRENINSELNPGFSHEAEIVIRKAGFVSDRTLAIKADKAAFELNISLIKYLKEKKNKIDVVIENKEV